VIFVLRSHPVNSPGGGEGCPTRNLIRRDAWGTRRGNGYQTAVTADPTTPGDGPAPAQQALVEALLGLRWALPRTDADARAAISQLDLVIEQLRAIYDQVSADQFGEELPVWTAPVGSLIAQSAFALDWWRPVLEDIDLDWTINHQAHLSADLSGIASAGAQILDQIEPMAPPFEAGEPAPAEAVAPQPPPPLPTRSTAPAAVDRRIAAVFGSVGTDPSPAADLDSAGFDGAGFDDAGVNSAGLDSAALEKSARHRRPAYVFESAAPPPWTANPAPAPARPAQFAPPPRRPAQQPPPPSGPGPDRTNSGYPYSAADDRAAADVDVDADDDDLIVRSNRRRLPQSGMVLQTVVIGGAVAGLCWWAAVALGSNPHPLPTAGSAPVGSRTTPAAAHAPTSPAPATAKPTHRASASKVAVPVVTTPADTSASASAASMQLSLLGGSAQAPQIVVILAVHATGTGPLTVSIDYYGVRGGQRVAEQIASWNVNGKTEYQLGDTIPTSPYCGSQVTVTALSGSLTAAKTTSPGC
jgi:hypothetical protein